MKKRIITLVIILLTAFCFPSFAATLKNISVELNSYIVKVNGKALTNDNIMYKGNVYVRADKISDAVGKVFIKDTKTKIITINNKPTPTPVKVKQWISVKHWTGSGIKNTEPFKITGEKWRISYKTSNVNIAGILQIMVYKVSSDIADSLACNAMNEVNDISYVYKSGDFYLSINSANEDWDIVVEEYK